MRNQLMVEEMLRVLGAAAAESRASVEQPELAAALLRRAALSYAARRDAGTPEARRRCERFRTHAVENGPQQVRIVDATRKRAERVE